MTAGMAATRPTPRVMNCTTSQVAAGDTIVIAPSVHVVAAAAVAFGQDDDITVLTLKRLAAGAQPTAEFSRPRLVRA